MRVHLAIRTNAAHLQQFFTGLDLLARSGRIRLTTSVTRDALATRVPPFAQSIATDIEVEGRTVRFDMSDGGAVSEEVLARCDWFFKRSLPLGWQPPPGVRARVRPYGLSYMVMPDRFGLFPVKRALAFPRAGDWPRQVIRALDAGNRLHFSPRQSMLEQAPPARRGEPRILFLARAWDTGHDDHFELSDELREDRHRINETRAECIRRLRAEYGDRALVGMIDEEHARRHYPDCLIDPVVTEKRRYLQTVREYPICITTTGLHGSIGWKFGEYVALSRAIVSEPLNYQVPGDFAAGRHYAEFRSIDECIAQVDALVQDEARCLAMMEANWRYYQASLRPDAVVWNCLRQVVEDD
jgi:hypothetical protein